MNNSEEKINFSINGDPTPGYKNIAYRGLVYYTSQGYLRTDTNLTNGEDTYICYITKDRYEMHIVTSPSKVLSGENARLGAFNVGIAIPKGYIIGKRQNESPINESPISISKVVRDLREEFINKAMETYQGGILRYKNSYLNSLGEDKLNELFGEWIDQNYRLTPVERKEIVLKGKPDPSQGNSRKKLNFSSIEKIDQFFEDPNFSELVEYGSIEVVCAGQKDSLVVPRQKKYDLTLIYKKKEESLISTTSHSFFISESEKKTLELNEDIKMVYEKFNSPIKSDKVSLNQLREIIHQSGNNSHISIDDKNEIVKIEIGIVPREYKIEVVLEAFKEDGNKYDLSKDDRDSLCNKILFTNNNYPNNYYPAKNKTISFDEEREKCFISLKGMEITDIWTAVMKKNDEWVLGDSESKLDPKSDNNRITLRLISLNDKITLGLIISNTNNFNLTSNDQNNLIKKLTITPVKEKDTFTEKPVIDPENKTIIFTQRNNGIDWKLSSSIGSYKIERTIKSKDIKNGKDISLSLTKKKDQSDQTNKQPGYKVVFNVYSRKELPEDSIVSLEINGPDEAISETICLEPSKNKSGEYIKDRPDFFIYTGSKEVNPKLKDAHIIKINEKKCNNFKTDRQYPIETIEVEIGSGLSTYVRKGLPYIRKGLPILLIFVVGFMIGTLTQRYCNVPFPYKASENYAPSLDSLQQEIDERDLTIQELDSINRDLNKRLYKALRYSSIANEEEETILPIEEDKSTKDKGKKDKTTESRHSSQLSIRNKLLTELRAIKTDTLPSLVASEAKNITNKYLTKLSDDDKKWFNKNIINQTDNSTITGTVRKLKLKKKKENVYWSPFPQ